MDFIFTAKIHLFCDFLIFEIEVKLKSNHNSIYIFSNKKWLWTQEKSNVIVVVKKIFFYSHRLFGCPNNQIDISQLNSRKKTQKFNNMYTF